jgi:ABC-2 type transport system permease protein
MLVSGRAGVALIIPPGLGKKVRRGDGAQVQILVDGSDSVTANQGLAGSVLVTGTWAQDLLLRRLAELGFAAPSIPRLESRVWYNPDLKSRYYMVPAILAMILVVMTIILTSMAIVREKEQGTLEQLIVTPIRPLHMILGKLLPFVVIGFVQMTVVFLGTVLWFQVPFNGSAGVLYLLTLPFLLNTLGLGLLVSTVSQTQQQAMMTAVFFVMMPMMFLSGFAFPIESMPAWVQPWTTIVPLRWYLDIIRGTFLRGVGLEVLWKDAAILCLSGAVILSLAVARFRKRLD